MVGNKPARAIRPIIQCFFVGAYESWKKVPVAVKNLWFDEWKVSSSFIVIIISDFIDINRFKVFL